MLVQIKDEIDPKTGKKKGEGGKRDKGKGKGKVQKGGKYYRKGVNSWEYISKEEAEEE